MVYFVDCGVGFGLIGCEVGGGYVVGVDFCVGYCGE